MHYDMNHMYLVEIFVKSASWIRKASQTTKKNRLIEIFGLLIIMIDVYYYICSCLDTWLLLNCIFAECLDHFRPCRRCPRQQPFFMRYFDITSIAWYLLQSIVVVFFFCSVFNHLFVHSNAYSSDGFVFSICRDLQGIWISVIFLNVSGSVCVRPTFRPTKFILIYIQTKHI